MEKFDYKETDTHIYFWNSYLSNFYSCENLLKINLDETYPIFNSSTRKRIGDYLTKDWFYTSEQLYMVFKALYFEDFETLKKIHESDLPAQAKKLGRQVAGYNEEAWAKVRVSFMEKACFIKFSQNMELANHLLESGNKVLVEASPYDLVWGVGLSENDPLILDEKNWKGLNLLGVVLMGVRDLLRTNRSLF